MCGRLIERSMAAFGSDAAIYRPGASVGKDNKGRLPPLVRIVHTITEWWMNSDVSHISST